MAVPVGDPSAEECLAHVELQMQETRQELALLGDEYRTRSRGTRNGRFPEILGAIADDEAELTRLSEQRRGITRAMPATLTEDHDASLGLAQKAQVLQATYLDWFENEYPGLIEQLLSGLKAGDAAIEATAAAHSDLSQYTENAENVRDEILRRVGGLPGVPNPGAYTRLVTFSAPADGQTIQVMRAWTGRLAYM